MTIDLYTSQDPYAQPFASTRTEAAARRLCDALVAARGGYAYAVAKTFHGASVLVYAVGTA